jgi:hypothetical protein
MKKRIIAAGLLASGAALTGLAGSAYAQGSAPTTKPTGPGKGRVVVACVGKGAHLKGKPGKGKGIVTAKEAGKPPVLARQGKPVFKVNAKAAPPRLAKVIGGKGGVKITTPKGTHCFTVKPGAPGGPPPMPAH